jgi:hypothetical protein
MRRIRQVLSGRVLYVQLGRSDVEPRNLPMATDPN